MALYSSTCKLCNGRIEFTLEQGWFHPATGNMDCDDTVAHPSEIQLQAGAQISDDDYGDLF